MFRTEAPKFAGWRSQKPSSRFRPQCQNRSLVGLIPRRSRSFSAENPFLLPLAQAPWTLLLALAHCSPPSGTPATLKPLIVHPTSTVCGP
ncbi:hypothetical protein KSP40_PGU018029 [Platanthera guangdongensis]|uniref:Uncharacterized protein n=1 Tax=Platanthera guangdongensis TaxID=2320717 RepID=A0ABR2N014_9ASPA